MLWICRTLHMPLLYHSPILTGSSLENLWSKRSTEVAQLYDGNCGFQLGRRVFLQAVSHFLFYLICSFSIWHRDCPLCGWLKIWRNSFVLWCTASQYKKCIMVNGDNWFRFFKGKNVPKIFVSNASISICSRAISSKFITWYLLESCKFIISASEWKSISLRHNFLHWKERCNSVHFVWA